MRRHLWNQNPQFVDVVSNYCGREKFNSNKGTPHLWQNWLHHRSKNRKLTRICNYEGDGFQCKGYDQFFRTLDLTKKIYIDGGSAFHPLVDVTLTKEN